MEPSENQTFNHFTHKHSLETLISLPTSTIACNGCNLKISPGKNYYSCKTCSFSLHIICFNMPKKTRHPSHPNHHLTLLVASPNSISTCNACGHNISGFYYNCAECAIFYHILCASLPFCTSISSHSHTLKLEFSPPYVFSCDLCSKPSHFGWVYRCRSCEFDAHVSCAILDQKAETVPQDNTLTRQVIYSASIMETNRMFDHGIESSELMQLVVQGVADSSGELGRSKRLYQSENKDEESGIQSYQFSEMCFSIDLLKSYASHQDHKPLQENKEEDGDRNRNRNGLVFNPLYRAPENWLNDGYLIKGVNEDNVKVKPMVREQNVKLSAGSGRCLCRRWKLLGCFYSTRYHKCSKSFNNGGM